MLGLVLFGIFPPDLVGSIESGFHLARHAAPWPCRRVLILGKRADTVLPKIRNWMNQNAWVISEIVLVFFSALVIKSLVKG